MTKQRPDGSDEKPCDGTNSESENPESQEPVLSLPNLLTLVRLPMAAAVWLAGRSPWWLIGLMIVAAATDMLDGWFARRMRARREVQGLPTRNLGGPQGRGAWLDPLCDKIFVLSVIGAVWVHFQPEWWLMALIAAREVLLIPVAFLHRFILGLPGREHFDVRATPVGKLTTVIQFFSLWAILLEWDTRLGLAMMAAFLGLLVVLDYIARAIRAAAYSRSA